MFYIINQPAASRIVFILLPIIGVAIEFAAMSAMGWIK